MPDKVVKSALECPSCGMLSLGVDPEAEYVTCVHCKAVISVATGLAYFPKPEDAPVESLSGPDDASTDPGDDGGDPADDGGDLPDAGGAVPAESGVDDYLSGVA